MPEIIVQSFVPERRESKNRIRLRPLPGQGFDQDIRVAFSIEIREDFPVGTLFKVWADLIQHHSKPYLKATSEPVRVSFEEAKAFIKSSKTDT